MPPNVVKVGDRQYTANWSADAYYCHKSGQNCGECQIHKAYGLGPGTCKMPEMVEALIEANVPTTYRKKIPTMPGVRGTLGNGRGAKDCAVHFPDYFRTKGMRWFL